MAITHYYVRATNGADVAGQGTTHATAYKTPQFALNDIGATHGRNAVDGDQVNICDAALEGANVLAAPLSLATYGTPTATAPLVLRGYTAVANDGGVGEINCGGATMWAATTYDAIQFVHLDIHNSGANALINLDDYIIAYGCELHDCTATLIIGASLVAGCYIYDTASVGIYFNQIETVACYGNYIIQDAASAGIQMNNALGYIGGNIVLCRNTGAYGFRLITSKTGLVVIGNICYNTLAGTLDGIDVDTTPVGAIQNNIVCGWSGVGGAGIRTAQDANILGHNAFWNNTANYSIADQTFIDETANDVALAADPFTDAANGDFSLTDAAKLALAAKGWPASYLGAHANTVPNLNIGPIQMAAAAAGALLRHPGMTGGFEA